MADLWKRALRRWTEAGLIDAGTDARIRAFEQERTGTVRLQLPVWIALAFGALMLGAGLLLFVSAQWDAMSPFARFLLALFLVALFHISAAVTAARFAWLATTLHALGTVALGAGIFLAGQMFHLDEFWPRGLMLSAVGAAITWALLRDPVQMAMVALLTPAWLACEWMASLGAPAPPTAHQVEAAGLFLMSVVYFTAAGADNPAGARRVLLWIGGVSLPVTALALAAAGGDAVRGGRGPSVPLPVIQWVLGWTVALVAPWFVAAWLRRTPAWTHVLAVLWVVAELNIRARFDTWSLYAWWSIGAVALAAWGVRDGRAERVNMAAAIFATTVLAFYSSQVMDKLGRSASLVGFGVLFLAGGWALELVRRRLVRTTHGEMR